MDHGPAFQLYASDFYIDTADWTNAQVGAYFRLLMYEWVEGGLSPRIGDLARIAKIPHHMMQKMWSSKIGKKFVSNEAGLFINLRLEETRIRQIEYREHQRNSGFKGAMVKRERGLYPFNKTSNPSTDPICDPTSDPATDPATDHASQNQALQSSSSSSIKKNKTYSVFFTKFWDEYPNKKAKPNAYREWKRLNPDIEIVLTALKKQKEHKETLVAQGKFCPEWPHPERWIKNQRWLDEIESEPLDSTDRMLYEMKKEREKNEYT